MGYIAKQHFTASHLTMIPTTQERQKTAVPALASKTAKLIKKAINKIANKEKNYSF